ncbi:MAG TPA: tubulin-like doman-containing protein, partial [Thermomicrobiales bacterium]|nr:tubulin-like doman-containing protein [Thermomicrobiales bacterium]
MPGIFIGIGGIGGSIVAQVRQSLALRVAFAHDSPSAQEAAGQFRFLLIDTWKDGVALGFDAAECFDLPEGKDKFGVDDKIESWHHGGDAAFHNWWPEHKGAPLRTGAFSSGAGQLRIKGKLAYRIALTGQGRSVVEAVRDALHAIDAVLGPAPGLRTVPIYLVCSLGGGTGSGMALTLAQHLRQSMPEYCPLIGVFPLAGVTALGPGAADGGSIWANTDAAL